MIHNKYWQTECGVVISPISPEDMDALSEITSRKLAGTGLLWRMGEGQWVGIDYIITCDEQSDYIARLLFNVPVYYAPQLLGRPLKEGGVPVFANGHATLLTPMVS